ncbi:hypothetical protein ACH4TV_05365 [Streptomyces sp. NPDC020898]|uniref:hypothetical protein n=1 Tax=Streptomyces sp. NPDC020898 TaxID=3365101 RepID=UPI003788BF4A
MIESEVDARVDELVRGLRRITGALLVMASAHPDSARARELAVAASVLTTDVLPRLDDEEAVGPVEAAQAQGAVPPFRIPPSPTSAAGSTAIGTLVERYLPDLATRPVQPVLLDPELPYEKWRHLHRLTYRRPAAFDSAPSWSDPAPHLGRPVRWGIASSATVVRRMRHHYVTMRDLDSPAGQLAQRMLHASWAILESRAVRGDLFGGGHLLDRHELEGKLERAQWNAAVLAAGRGDAARPQLETILREFEILARAVLELDDLYRTGPAHPAVEGRLADALRGTRALIRHWPPGGNGAGGSRAAQATGPIDLTDLTDPTDPTDPTVTEPGHPMP